MMNLAKKLVPAKRLAARDSTPQTVLETGFVAQTTDGLTVRLGLDLCPARRAKSCLVAPDVGDRVLCAVEGDAVFVLAVLEGAPGAATRVSADGDLKLQATTGRLTLGASEGIDLVTGKTVGVTGGAVHVRAQTGSVAVEELGFLSRLVRAEVGRVALLAEHVDSTVTRIVQRAKRAFRFVEEVEQVRAGTLDLRAENLAAIRADNTLVTARVLAKIDAAQVHIG
ncbi:MAG: DUF3540 domain-containing protein [Myxococcales bacterium]|nr:DUF3540 domain-containing protein [Myxococcales bacterium]